MIEQLRREFLAGFHLQAYQELLVELERTCGTPIRFRVAETPVFFPSSLLENLAETGRELTERLLASQPYLAAAEQEIPPGYRVAGRSLHPNFMTADFALVRGRSGELEPRLVELQAFPSVFGYQAELAKGYRRAFGLDPNLEIFLSGLTEEGYWNLLRETIVGRHDPSEVVLTEVDPENQKTLPDFRVTAHRLGIAVVDITRLEAVGRRLAYRDASGRQVLIRRIYNRAIADEMMARQIRPGVDLEAEWDVEWAGHPNWYFRVSKFALPWLSGTVSGGDVKAHACVPPAAFLDDFLGGAGYLALQQAGVPLPELTQSETVFEHLLLKPLYSFAGKGIVFSPTLAELQSISPKERRQYLVQQRMQFEPTVETPAGRTQAEIRILYAWPEDGAMTAAISLVRLGRGRMMGVDHNRDLEWVGASAAFGVRNAQKLEKSTPFR